MRVWLSVLLMVIVLSGCSNAERFETISDDLSDAGTHPACKIVVSIPQDAYTSVFENGETGSLYLCDGYEISLQTFPSGDLDRTLKEISGFSEASLTLLKTSQQDMSRYDCAWTAAGETGARIGRAAILDDGNYHYTMTVMADSGDAGALQETWQGLFATFQVVSTGS